MASNNTESFVVVKRRNKKKNFKHFNHLEAKIKDGDDEIPNFDINNFLQRAEVEVSDFFSHSFDLINRALEDLKQKKIPSHSKERDEAKLECSPKDVLNDASSKQVTELNLPDLTSRLDATPAFEAEDGHSIELLSYGIGNFTSTLIARYQLAFFLSLRKKLGQQCKKCSVYDPAFTVNEKLLLEKYNCDVISQNEEGCRECVGPTIAFLPHCGRPLYNNLLWRNLSTPEGRGLNNLVLIGNSFSQIVERTPASILKETGSYILKLQPHISENSLPENFALKDVFNDLAVHTFPPAAAEAVLGEVIGVQLKKPQYESPDIEEFIRK